MQTVSIADLRDEPIQSLSSIHIQPPALDLIRACFVLVWHDEPLSCLLWRVDQALLLTWAVLYSLMGVLAFVWMRHITNAFFAALSALSLLVHPSVLYYATFMDTTNLTAFLVLCLCYAMWRMRRNSHASITPVSLIVVALVLTRSAFEWIFFLVVGVALFLLRVRPRKMISFACIAGGMMSLYALKQYYQFGTSATSSFAGMNLCRSIGYFVDYGAYAKEFESQPACNGDVPNVLRRTYKMDGSVNFNNHNYLAVNSSLIAEYVRRMRATPISELGRTYLENAAIYLQQSRGAKKHAFVDRLPWVRAYDAIFSRPVLPILLFIATLVWLLRAGPQALRGKVGLSLPLIYIVFVSVVFEKGENSRFKAFVEPVVVLFLMSQLYSVYAGLCRLGRGSGPRKGEEVNLGQSYQSGCGSGKEG